MNGASKWIVLVLLLPRVGVADTQHIISVSPNPAVACGHNQDCRKPSGFSGCDQADSIAQAVCPNPEQLWHQFCETRSYLMYVDRGVVGPEISYSPRLPPQHRLFRGPRTICPNHIPRCSRSCRRCAQHNLKPGQESTTVTVTSNRTVVDADLGLMNAVEDMAGSVNFQNPKFAANLSTDGVERHVAEKTKLNRLSRTAIRSYGVPKPAHASGEKTALRHLFK